jgi:hypothetical protein
MAIEARQALRLTESDMSCKLGNHDFGRAVSEKHLVETPDERNNPAAQELVQGPKRTFGCLRPDFWPVSLVEKGMMGNIKYRVSLFIVVFVV